MSDSDPRIATARALEAARLLREARIVTLTPAHLVRCAQDRSDLWRACCGSLCVPCVAEWAPLVEALREWMAGQPE